VEQNGCTACHGPHVGFGKGLQKKDGVEQCLSCHNNREFTGPVQHPPAFEDCTNCHDPHSSDYKKLLSTADIMELCTTCHEDAKKKHYHPMGAGVINPRTKTDLVCTGCHSPHSTEEKMLLLADKNRKLCNLCHATDHE
jgi:predicted CXXCH cytochrome family protein